MYEHKCFECGHGFEEFRAISAPSPEKCPKCGSDDLRAILDSPTIIGDIQPYNSIVTGELITSRARHREHLKQHDLVEVGDQKPASLKRYEEQLSEKAETSHAGRSQADA